MEEEQLALQRRIEAVEEERNGVQLKIQALKRECG